MAYFVLKRGDSGDDVKQLQAALIERGVLGNETAGTPNEDGRFGRITEDAVKKFQQERHLDVDGIVGRETAAALGLDWTARLQAQQQSVAAARNAPPAHVLSEQQLALLAEKIDALIPTGPFDLIDGPLISWLVSRLDAALAKILPSGVLAYINDFNQGLPSGDFSVLKARLVKTLNAHINVPLIPEHIEEKIIAFFVDVIADALQLGRTFDTALAKPAGA
ncbi:peptidoglycan-binding protein [Zoogloea sp. LCSB751]|uniref:peptidoglycan-binding domain-containing protein n=1 Tax=Zoogloea sp. LCSB751 TaxID=1965277 RepID=UPI0013747645|nr:peptidoglycan-binding domain-containing protein [Zoogloea sp. LCSB751]